MPVIVSFEEPARFLMDGSGIIAADECIAGFEQILADPRLKPGFTILGVAHDVTGVPSADELRYIAEAAKALRKRGLENFAIVTPPGYVYGVARMFAAIADLAGVPVEVFLDIDDARARLDEVPA